MSDLSPGRNRWRFSFASICSRVCSICSIRVVLSDFATSAVANGAASFVVPVDNEPAPRLIVETPLPGPLARGVVYIPYRVENLRILAVGGAAARNLSPRVGHLHITVDDLPGLWATSYRTNVDVLLAGQRGSS